MNHLTFNTDKKIAIMESYLNFLKSEIKSNGMKPGIIDNEHILISKRILHNLKYIKEGTTPYDNYETPMSVQLELTSKCNQACIMCYNQSGMDKNTHNEDLSIDQWIKIAQELASIHIPQIIISGGEPTLLREDLFKIMDIFNEVGTHFIFINNGMLINEGYIKKLAKYHYSWMQFSVDGATEEVHDYIRGAKGAFKKVINSIALARANGIPVGIASAIQRKNIHQVGDLIDLAYHLGAYKHVMGQFLYAGRAVTNGDDIGLNENDIIMIKKITHDKMIEHNNLLSIDRPVDPALSLRIKMCSPNGGLLIRPNGEVRIDCIAPVRIGNVKEQNILNIWNKVGKYAWGHPLVLEYIDQIKIYKDMNTVHPRTHYEPDIDISLKN